MQIKEVLKYYSLCCSIAPCILGPSLSGLVTVGTQEKKITAIEVIVNFQTVFLQIKRQGSKGPRHRVYAIVKAGKR